MRVKKGDMVAVISGKSKGQRGAIVRAMPRDELVVIDGVNMVKKHQRRTAQNRKGQIIDRPMPIHVSNVMLVDPSSKKPTRVKFTRDADGARKRIAVKSGQEVK